MYINYNKIVKKCLMITRVLTLLIVVALFSLFSVFAGISQGDGLCHVYFTARDNRNKLPTTYCILNYLHVQCQYKKVYKT